jgi:hypothetical protein
MLSVSNNEGTLTGIPSSAFETLTLGSTTATNTEVVARYSSGSFNNDVGRLVLRYNNVQNYYAVGLGSPSGSPVLQISKKSGGTMVQLCSLPFTATNGTFYWIRARVQTSLSSATISMRAWADGAQEPTTWGLSCSDASPLGAGLTGVNAWDGGLTWLLDSFSAGNLG